MKPVRGFLVGLLGIIVLNGCNGGGSDPEPKSKTATETVFDPLVDALDKAEAAQDLELERKRRIDEELER